MNDCFAFKQRSCGALTVKKCEGCSFYKTIEEYEAGHQRAMERIQSLDKVHRELILDKYYRKRGR